MKTLRKSFGFVIWMAVLFGLGYWLSGILSTKSTRPDFDILPWLGLLFEVMGKVDWLNALLIICGFAILLMLIIWQLTPGDGMDFRMLFADWVGNGHGRWIVRAGKCWQAGAFLITSWGFVYVTTHDKLTEAYLFLFAALWAGSPALNRWAAAKFPVPEAAGEPSVAGTTTTTKIETTEVKTP